MGEVSTTNDINPEKKTLIDESKIAISTRNIIPNRVTVTSDEGQKKVKQFLKYRKEMLKNANDEKHAE